MPYSVIPTFRNPLLKILDPPLHCDIVIENTTLILFSLKLVVL